MVADFIYKQWGMVGCLAIYFACVIIINLIRCRKRIKKKFPKGIDKRNKL